MTLISRIRLVKGPREILLSRKYMAYTISSVVINVKGVFCRLPRTNT